MAEHVNCQLPPAHASKVDMAIAMWYDVNIGLDGAVIPATHLNKRIVVVASSGWTSQI